MDMDKVKKIAKSDFCISAILTAVTFFICLLVSNFNVIYATTDDLGTELMAVKGYLTPFISYFLSVAIIKLQTVFTKVNVFILLQIILNVVSVFAISFCFLKRFNKKAISIFCIFIINLLFAYTSFVLLQFTQTATIVCTAGYLIIFTVFKIETVKGKKIAGYIIGTLFILMSALIRTSCFYSVTLIFIIYTLCDLYMYIGNKRIKKDLLAEVFNKYIKVAVVCAFACILALGATRLSNYFLDLPQNIQGLRQYNTIRSQVEDYDIVPYENNEEFYNSIDIYSQNDLDILQGWVLDQDFFNSDRLSAIADYSSDYRSGKMGVLRAVNLVYDMVCQYTSVFSLEGFLITLILCAIIGLAVLFIFRNKLKMLFPFMFLISFLAYIVLRRSAPVLLIPLVAIAFITGLFFNRRHFVCITAIYGVVLSLTFYMSLTRISFRTVHSVCLPAIICMFLLIDKANLQKRYQNISKNNVKKILSSASVVVLTLICMLTAYMIPKTAYVKTPSPNAALNKTIENDAEHLFVTDVDSGVSIIMGNSDSPLRVPYRCDNVLIYGSMVGSPYFEDVKDSFGVSHLLPDMIDNDNVYYLISVDKTEKMEKMEQYFNDHYAENNEQVTFDIVDEVNGAYIFKVIREEIKD